MCGIVGLLTIDFALPAGALERGTRALAHRGPDDSGTVVLRGNADHASGASAAVGGSAAVEVGLGNRRLAILDLSPAGHQPMQDAATGNWIVYNGEIYNFRELRTRLESLGAQFQGHSDTEVL